MPEAAGMNEVGGARKESTQSPVILFVHRLTTLLILWSLLPSLPGQESGDKPTPAPAPALKPVIEPYPDAETVGQAVKKAASFARTSLSLAGGYATGWSLNLKKYHTAGTESPTVISIEDPGTPSIGLIMIRAYQITGDKLYFQAAQEVKQALLWTQLASGGWDTLHDFAPAHARRRHYRRDLEAGDTERGSRTAHSTLDDDKTQFALRFLLELAHLPASKDDKPLHDALKFGMDALLAAQMPHGGWPQGFSGPADPTLPVKKPTLPQEWLRKWPELNYTGYVTLNDGNLLSIAKLLTRAHELAQDQRYLTALKKLGDFHLLAQCPEPQPGWAQQYSADMEPTWARKFEPPSVAGHESLWALETLHEVWLATGDDKYKAPYDSALAWLERSRLPGNQHARFYELHTNKPLYFVKDTYELTHDDSNLPTHYSFKSSELQEDIDAFKKLIALPRDEQLAKRAAPPTPRAWLSRAKGAAKKAVAALGEQSKEGVWIRENIIDGSLFVKNMHAMINYLEAAKNAGPEFDKFRAEQKSAKQ